MKLSATWFEIFSELFVNLAAGWIGISLLELPVLFSGNLGNIFLLTIKLASGILSLYLAKMCKDAHKKL